MDSLALLALAVGSGVWIMFSLLYTWHRHLNGRVRREVLADTTSLYGLTSVLHTVSFLRLGATGAAFGDPDLAAAVTAATEAAVRCGGKVRYVGRVAALVVKCEPFTDAEGFDVVLLIEWKDATTATAWRADALAEGSWNSDVSQGFWRNPILNLLLTVVGLQVLKLKTVLSRSPHSLVEPALKDAGGRPKATRDVVDKLTTAAGDHPTPEARAELMAMLADLMDQQGAPGDGMVVFNLLNDSSSTAAEKVSDASYGMRMMEMLVRHGGGVIHIGQALGLGSPERDGEWRTLAAVHYPGRACFTRMLRSKWMHATVQGKKPGKSIAALTSPFFPAAEPAVCLQDY